MNLRQKPEVTEVFGSPEIYADGWIVKENPLGSTVQVVFFVTRGENMEIARVHIPRSEYDYWRAVYRRQILAEAVH